ncbi:hypothetical protein [Stigmatella aurantiaca]|uniref:Uncharacterized protein n=1 Tax=Stigmatella aurantiaca (strain DW4/3-1) TaxID=378806 RepID=Q08XC9_STIAD|nr:hypothetical protein [Stigmatella aurantiaca]ADO72315.1 uncharacterized protein STAUR_4535 [Stigmatella aurantiaca DW4/3-1]EAU65138.1 hypothetical protein STIAU_6775 [Stigmatella aurantiaca DW4/3-1]
MTGLLLMGLASLRLVTADVSGSAVATCQATAEGPTFGLGTGLMYFHFNTTCDAVVNAITINASVDGPRQDRAGTKTCAQTNECSYVVSVPYARGTWLWTNSSSVMSHPSALAIPILATNAVTYSQ